MWKVEIRVKIMWKLKIRGPDTLPRIYPRIYVGEHTKRGTAEHNLNPGFELTVVLLVEYKYTHLLNYLS